MLQALDRTATVAEIVAEHASTARVFERHEIDLQQRGDATVHEVCRERHLDPHEVLAQVEDAITAAPEPPAPNRRQVPDAALVSHIVENHHAAARRTLPYVVPLLAKVAGRHGRRDARLGILCDAGQQLADALEVYMDGEEQALFPALLAGAREAVRAELPVLHRRRREIEQLLARVRALADGYAAPEWADRSYRVLMEELQALEEQVTEELKLESSVLVPRMLSRCAEGA